jgi:two-component SAPR family response regulator
MIIYLYEGTFFSIILLSFIFFPKKSYAQNYGLEFASYNTTKDLRTSLNLNPAKAFSFNSDFELSFKFGLYNMKQLFGYVLRTIINDTLNIDLQLNYMVINGSYVITVIVGRKIYEFPQWTVGQNLYDGWEEFRLKFNVEKNQIIFCREGKENTINFQFPAKIIPSFIFGATDSPRFINTDVPPMRLKDVRLYYKNKLIRNWLLDESCGNQAYDSLQNAVAEISNPHWINPRYNHWQLIRKFALPGMIISTLNERTGDMYFLKDDSLLIYSLKSNRIRRVAFSKGHQTINIDSRLAINSHSQALYHYFLDAKDIIRFDTITCQWDHDLGVRPRSLRHYTQHNTWFSEHDSSFYFFWGYGFYKYRDTLFRYHIPSNTWSEVSLKGDPISPRYLFASGVAANSDSVYMLGGYGSVSGDQRINPQSYKDIFVIDIKNKSSKKIGMLNALPEDYCFAHSLILAPDQKSFYALCFTRHKFYNWLKLIKGNLKSFDFDLVGDSIPYLFEDVRSNAELYYVKDEKKLVCSTSIFTENHDSTYIELFAIQFPPNLLQGRKTTYHVERLANKFIPVMITFILGGLILLWLLRMISKKAKNRPKEKIVDHGEEEDTALHEPVIPDIKPGGNENISNSLFFFGGLQIFSREGTEISPLFSPLLKELFLLIFFHSQSERKGISTEMLTQMLWFDKNSSQAHNNLYVNISKLRHITERVEGLNLLKKDGYWKIEIQPDKLKVDYLKITKYIQNGQIGAEQIHDFLVIVKKGSFLIWTNYEWLDKIKGELTNHILDLLFAFEKSNKVEHDLVVKIADAIFIHDSLNEEALKLKYKALIAIGRHHLAKIALEKFKVEYFSLYGEHFHENLSGNLQEG